MISFRWILMFLPIVLIFITGCAADKSSNLTISNKESPNKIEELINKLGTEDWQTRENATKELEEIGGSVLEPLRKTLEKNDNPKVRRRAERLIKSIETKIMMPLETMVTNLLERLTEPLAECKVITVPSAENQHSSMAFQVSVLVNGAYWDESGNIYWGASEHTGWKMIYTFVAKEVLNESITKKDYNKDNDLFDTFERGEIVLEIRDETNALQKYVSLGGNVLVVNGDRDTDINNDGTSDPLFLRIKADGNEDINSGSRIRINLWLSKEDITGVPLIMNKQVKCILLNPQ